MLSNQMLQLLHQDSPCIDIQQRIWMHLNTELSYRQGSFPAGMPGNGVPKVILTVGTAFKPALGELYKKLPVYTKNSPISWSPHCLVPGTLLFLGNDP